MRNEEQRELLAKLSTNTDIQPHDCHPLRLNPSTIPKPTPPAQRTVFPIDTDWASSSTQTVLDAFKESFQAQVEEAGLNKTILPLLRSSGAVEIDASMADLFDDGLLGSTNVIHGGAERLVQCNNCHRPVLITRILAHAKRCTGNEDEDDETDTEMQLICPPYGKEIPSSPKTPPPEPSTPKSSLGKGADESKSFVKEEHDWRTRITPVIPRYVPRGATSKKRRYALPPPCESPAQRKKNINVERKALAAAASAGLTAANPQNPTDTKDKSGDALRKLAQKWGPSAPWSKLMQVALPLVVPRNPKRRNPSGKEPQPSNGNGVVPVNGPAPSPTNSAKSGGKPVETSDKQSSLAQQGPTLLGSLLWLRGQGMKELSNTSLHNMDVPQMPISRSGAIFHGQAFVAGLGTFQTDPRPLNTIKLPLVNVNPTSTAQAAQSRANPTRSGSADTRMKQPTSQPSMSATNSGSSQAPPPTKKQRTSKQQRSQAMPTNGQHFNPGVAVRTGQAPSRKMTNVRMPGGGSAGRVTVGAQETLQRMQHRNVPQPPKGVHAMNQAVAGVTNAAAVTYAASQALQQKKVFRPGVGGNIPMNRLAPGTVPGSAPTAAGVARPAASKTNVARNAKGRTHSGVGSASPSMRSTGSVAVKSQSPGQRSSRSTDRTSMRTPTGVSQYDPALLASAAAVQVAAGGNHTAAMRPGPGNPHLDLQQVVARMAGAQNRGAGRDDSFDPTRVLVPNMAAAHQADNANARLQQQALRGMSPHARLKQQAAVQTAVQRSTAAMKNRQPYRMRKDEVELKKTPSIIQQLQQAEAREAMSVAGKVNALPNTVPFTKPGDPTASINRAASHGFYSAAIAATGQAAPAAAPNTALKGNPNFNQLLRIAHGQQTRLVPGQPDVNANLLQNMQDMHQMQNMPVVPGMRGAPQNSNAIGMLRATALNAAGNPNAAMNSGAGAGLGGGVAMPGQNANLFANEAAILQRLLGARNPQVNPNAQMHAQQMARAGQLSHPQQLPRTAGIPHPVNPTAQENTALEELDRAPEIDRVPDPNLTRRQFEFDEKDLIDESDVDAHDVKSSAGDVSILPFTF